MTTTKRRRERQEWRPDLGLLSSRLTRLIEDELFERLDARGFKGLLSRHAAVLSYLDEDGVRATDLAQLTGRHKQVVGRLVDELEELGYVERRPDPADRRAKLVAPTKRGLELLRLQDEIVAAIERRHAEEIGARAYAEVREVMRRMVEMARPIRPIG